jgi:hypothetical protein
MEKRKFKGNSGYILRNKGGKKRWVRNTKHIPNRRADALDVAAGALGAGVGGSAAYYARRESINNPLMKNYMQHNSSKGVRNRLVKSAQQHSAAKSFYERELKNINTALSNPDKMSKKRRASLAVLSKKYNKGAEKAAASLSKAQSTMAHHQKIMDDSDVIIKKLTTTKFTPRAAALGGAVLGVGLGAAVYGLRNRRHKNKMALRIDAELRKEKEELRLKRQAARRRSAQPAHQRKF